MSTENFRSVDNENAGITPKRTFMFTTRNITDINRLIGTMYTSYFCIFRGITALAPIEELNLGNDIQIVPLSDQ